MIKARGKFQAVFGGFFLENVLPGGKSMNKSLQYNVIMKINIGNLYFSTS